jgi:hypothetical protein
MQKQTEQMLQAFGLKRELNAGQCARALTGH